MRIIFASVVALAAVSFSGSRAFAAGYTCLSVDQDMQVIVTIDPEHMGSAKHATFIDPTLSKRRQVVAVFSDADLQSEVIAEGVRYIADAKVAASGKRIGGTRASALDQIVLDVQTVSKRAESREVHDGDAFAAQVSYVKKNGAKLVQDFDCAAFLGDDAPALTALN